MPTEEEKLLIRIEATQKKFEQQMKRAASSARTNAKKAETAWKQANKGIEQSVTRTSRAFARLNNLSGRQRFMLQNAANQFGDIAVQINGGAGAARALSQQLPQLLGGFGPLGAALGTVAAIGIPLISTLFNMGDASEGAGQKARTAAEGVEALRSAVSDYAAAAAAANIDTAKLREKFGGIADEVGEIKRDIAEAKKFAAIQALETSADEISRRFGAFDFISQEDFADLDRFAAKVQQIKASLSSGLGTLPGGVQQKEQIAQYQAIVDLIAKVRDEFSLTEQQAQAFVAALNALQSAQGPQDIFNALSAVRDVLIEAAGGVENMTAKQLEFFNELSASRNEAANLVSTLGQAPGAIDAATASASRLAAELVKAGDAAATVLANQKAAAQAALTTAKINLRFRKDPVGRAGALAEARAPAIDPNLPDGQKAYLNRLKSETVEIAKQSAELNKLKQELDKVDAKKNRSSRGGGGGRKRKSGGGGGSRGGAAGLGFSGFANSIREQTQALRQQIGAAGEASGQLDAYAVSVERARIEEELLRRAQREGIEITPQLKEQIAQLAQSYAEAKVAAGGLANATKQVGQAGQNTFGSLGKSVLKGFITDLRNGKSATEALLNALEKVADQLLDMALNAIFSGLGGGGGIFGLFAGGGGLPGFRRGGVLGGSGSGTSDSNIANGPGGAIRYSRGEFLVNAAATRENLGLLEAINAGRFKPPSGSSGQASSPARSGGAAGTSIKVINAIDATEVVSQAMSTRAGEQAVLNRMAARPGAYRAALGIT